jgi:hypothetical protein
MLFLPDVSGSVEKMVDFNTVFKDFKLEISP